MPQGRGGLVLLALLIICGTCRGLPLELTAANMTSTFQGLPGSRWVVMEFYAHWSVIPRPSTGGLLPSAS